MKQYEDKHLFYFRTETISNFIAFGIEHLKISKQIDSINLYRSTGRCISTLLIDRYTIFWNARCCCLLFTTFFSMPIISKTKNQVACLPQLMSALRDGWLLEESEEDWQETSCFRLTVDQTGEQNGKILSTLWLRQEDGTPLRGEIAVDGEIILTADFTSFSFYDTIENQE